MSDLDPRKHPQQERSRATVDAIVEATAQLLVEEGFHKMTTNGIAERAGVSVGSVYQYFPNKEAIVVAVVERFADEQLEILAEGIEASLSAPLEEAVHTLIDKMLEAKRSSPDLNRVLFGQLPPVGQIDILFRWTDAATQVVSTALEMRSDEFAPDDLELAAFLIVNACHGIVHSTVVNRPDLLDTEALADETTRLVLRYLKP